MNRIAGASTVFGALVALAGGCDTERTSGSALVVRDSAGVEFVENRADGLWGEVGAAVEEVVRIGVVEGDERFQFYRVRSVDVAADGTIAVGSDQAASVRLFTARGEFVREFGRRGEGPGEYIMVDAVRAVGDSVIVMDWQGGGRAGVYDGDGSLVEFWPLTLTNGEQISLQSVSPGGAMGVLSVSEPPTRLEPGAVWEYQPLLVRFDPATGTVTDTVFRPPPRKLYGGTTGTVEIPLFDALLAIDFDGAGKLYVSRGDPYRIEVYEIAGAGDGARAADADYRLARVITRELPRVPFTDSDIEQIETLIAKRYDTMTAMPADRRSASRDRLLERVGNQRRTTRPRTCRRCAGCSSLPTARSGSSVRTSFRPPSSTTHRSSPDS